MKKTLSRGLSSLAALALVIVVQPTTQACGLEPMINGGFTVSHPGSIEVAVAVAKARRDGVLPPAKTEAISKAALLQRMLGDLKHLRTQLVKGQAATESFSVVLVGPGLWSHFYSSDGGILGRYHVTGPLAGKVTVLTHHAVLRALLNGELSINKATELGLITYSGDNAEAIRGAFESGFLSDKQMPGLSPHV